MSGLPLDSVTTMRELGRLKRAYGAACVSLRSARELADAAREVLQTNGRRDSLARLATAVKVWEARTTEEVR